MLVSKKMFFLSDQVTWTLNDPEYSLEENEKSIHLYFKTTIWQIWSDIVARIWGEVVRVSSSTRVTKAIHAAAYEMWWIELW